MKEGHWSAQEKSNLMAHESLAFYRACVVKDGSTRKEVEKKQPSHWSAQEKSNLMAHESLAFYRACVTGDIPKK